MVKYKVTPVGIKLLQEFHLLGKLCQKFIQYEIDLVELDKTWAGVDASYLEMFPKSRAVDLNYLERETGDELPSLKRQLSRLLARGYITEVK
jgi:hypothetical protein